MDQVIISGKIGLEESPLVKGSLPAFSDGGDVCLGPRV